MQISFDIPTDVDDPVSAYLKLRELQPRYLLESRDGGDCLARYSFLGFGDALEVRLDADGMVVDGKRRDYPADGNEYLAALRDALDQAPVLKPYAKNLSFAGGLVGVTGYDVVRLFEALPRTCPPLNIPQAAYCATSSLLVFDNLKRRAALLHAGTASERKCLRRDVVRLLQIAPQPSCTECPRSHTTPDLTEAEYVDRIKDCKKHIATGDIAQIVISVLFKGRSKVSPLDVYRALRTINPSPYLFFFEFGHLKVVGSSPEMLVRLQNRNASMRPIAGTFPRGETPAEDQQNEQDLLSDPKESAEHEMLIDSARIDLARVATVGTIRVDPYRSIERYSHVMHIVSGVHGELQPDLDAFDLFAASLPVGTLVGAPKKRAMEIIDELEDTARGLYGGTAGYFCTSGDIDQAVTIRTIVFNGDEYSFQAGGGIVADSVPQKEYQEVLAKSAVLRRAIAMAEKGL